MTDKGDIPPIQCTTSLWVPFSTRKVDGLSLFFICFYVPEFTPLLNSTETSLQLSENTTLFAVVAYIYIGIINKEN
jgi:hypothetical protein